jgi:epoxyqueuosine reductase
VGAHIFGCDICQDVCPWNRRAPITEEPGFLSRESMELEILAKLSPEIINQITTGSPIARAKPAGILRNIAVAMGNLGLERFREPLEDLAASPNEMVAEHARWALKRL